MNELSVVRLGCIKQTIYVYLNPARQQITMSGEQSVETLECPCVEIAQGC